MIRISPGLPASRNAQNIKTTAGLGTDAAREETMAREFKLPDIGEGVHEGEVVKWFVKEGDPVKENDPIVEVMTDKVTVQIPSPVTGRQERRHHPRPVQPEMSSRRPRSVASRRN